jgi:hypothetical protein
MALDTPWVCGTTTVGFTIHQQRHSRYSSRRNFSSAPTTWLPRTAGTGGIRPRCMGDPPAGLILLDGVRHVYKTVRNQNGTCGHQPGAVAAMHALQG